MAYNFDPNVKKVCLTWVGVGKACVEKDEKTKDTIAKFEFEKTSIGEMVERFVSWATGAKFGLVAPWNVLNEISLSKFELTYNFTKNKVSFGINIGPVDLGLFKLKGVSLEYNPENKSGERFQITVDGQFVWEKGDSISWNPDNPSSTPTPPGSGSKYLDLRLLAAGQHVTVGGLTEQRNVQKAIALLRDLKSPILQRSL